MKRLVPLFFCLALAACGNSEVAATSEATPVTSVVSTTTVAEVTTTSVTLPPTTTTDVTTPPTAPPTTIPEVPALSVVDGEVEGPDTIRVVLGETAVFTVTSDVADEVHVHGFDLTYALEPGVTAEVRFLADVPGIFEVELHGAHVLLTQLVVEP